MGNLNVIVLATTEDKARGLQFMPTIPEDTFFVFTGVPNGTPFHSRNVNEPFDIIFMSSRGEILEATTLVPPNATISAPPRSAYAIEAKEGELSKRSMEIGRVINMDHLLGK